MKIVIIGHTVGVKRVIQAVADSNHSIEAVFTHPKESHQYDLDLFDQHASRFGEYAFDVFDIPQLYDIPVHEYSELKTQESIAAFQAFSPDMIVTIGCRSILTSNFIAAFQHVINLHPFHLPFYRGAGLDSWMILKDGWGKEQFSTAHFITPKIDAGNILARRPYVIPMNAKPLDIFKTRIDTLGELFIEAADKLAGNPDFKGEAQDHESSRYFPRLQTNRDGEISFAEWHIDEIHKFVQAFSYPYPGSFFHYDGKLIRVFDSEVFPDDEGHAFGHGLVFRKSNDSLWIYAKGGAIRLFDLRFDDGTDINKIKLGKFVSLGTK